MKKYRPVGKNNAVVMLAVVVSLTMALDHQAKGQTPEPTPEASPYVAVAVYVMVPGQKLALEMRESGKAIAPDGVLLTTPGIVKTTIKDGKVEVEALIVGATFLTVPAVDGAAAANAFIVVGRDEADAKRLADRVRAAQAGAR